MFIYVLVALGILIISKAFDSYILAGVGIDDIDPFMLYSKK